MTTWDCPRCGTTVPPTDRLMLVIRRAQPETEPPIDVRTRKASS